MTTTPIAIALPFSLDSYGKISSTTDQSKIWSDRVLSVLGTRIRERVMRVEYGTTIPYALFEGADQATAEIKEEVRSAFNSFLPSLKLTATNVTFDTPANVINVEVRYTIPNLTESTTIIGIVTIDGTTPIYEELK